MENTITPQQEEMAVKAASAGFAQSLINRGFDEETVKRATIAYVHPEQGLLVKRAANIANLQGAVANTLQRLRGAAQQA